MFTLPKVSNLLHYLLDCEYTGNYCVYYAIWLIINVLFFELISTTNVHMHTYNLTQVPSFYLTMQQISPLICIQTNEQSNNLQYAHSTNNFA